MGKLTATATKNELVHQKALLQTHTRQLQTIEQQIAIFGPALVPVHLLAQRDWFEAERTKALRRIQSLERTQAKQQVAASAQAEVHVLNATLPTGLLHLLSKDDLPLVRVELVNPTSSDIIFIVTSWIDERTFTRTDRIHVPAKSRETIVQLPLAKPQAFVDSYEMSKGTLQARVSVLRNGTEALLNLQSFEVSFLARDVLLWGTVRSDGNIDDLADFIGAWVTPNERSIVELLRQATEYAPGKQFVGYQGGGSLERRAGIIRDQVRAIFEALKAHTNIRYINAPLSVGPTNQEIRQRISLPRDSIAFRQANCIDGAVLYASLIERAALNAVIVIVPGHAFVGWETWRDSGSFEFLETTMTASSSFDEALQRGQAQFASATPLLGRPLFDQHGFARVLNVAELRQAGVRPME